MCPTAPMNPTISNPEAMSDIFPPNLQQNRQCIPFAPPVFFYASISKCARMNAAEASMFTHWSAESKCSTVSTPS